MGGHEAHYAILCRAQMIQPTASEPGGPSAPRGDTYQWARKGRQGAELLVVLRRVMRTARDWRVPVWVVKLDIRKAFDSVWQESMGRLVAARVGRLLASGGTAMGGQPWEARAWLGLLEAREVRVALGEQVVPGVPGQPHPLRQGDSGRPGGGPSFHQPPAAASKGTSTTTVGGILYGWHVYHPPEHHQQLWCLLPPGRPLERLVVLCAPPAPEGAGAARTT